MSEENQDIEEDIKKEMIEEKAREINDGRMEVWIHENHSSLVNEFIEQADEFKEYTQMRFREAHE